MSLIVWLGDEVGLQKTPSPMEGLYWKVINENFDGCFTKYGFVIPLTDFNIDYCAVIENRMPPIPDHVRDASSGINWMLIDHHGVVWQIDGFADTESKMNIRSLSIFTIPVGGGASIVLSRSDADRDFVAGFLMNNPDKEAVTNFVFDHKINYGRKLHWFSKKEIIDRLHKEFPLMQELAVRV